jgi:hypothetical protein
MIGIRPSTLRRLRQARHDRVSPLHISIAGMSYMKEQKQQQSRDKEGDKESTFYRIIKRGGA